MVTEQGFHAQARHYDECHPIHYPPGLSQLNLGGSNNEPRGMGSQGQLWLVEERRNCGEGIAVAEMLRRLLPNGYGVISNRYNVHCRELPVSSSLTCFSTHHGTELIRTPWVRLKLIRARRRSRNADRQSDSRWWRMGCWRRPESNRVWVTETKLIWPVKHGWQKTCSDSSRDKLPHQV